MSGLDAGRRLLGPSNGPHVLKLPAVCASTNCHNTKVHFVASSSGAGLIDTRQKMRKDIICQLGLLFVVQHTEMGENNQRLGGQVRLCTCTSVPGYYGHMRPKVTPISLCHLKVDVHITFPEKNVRIHAQTRKRTYLSGFGLDV
jgi:hypothetical protein